jgi:putative transposase
MDRAPQELRTYLVTAVTAQRRRLFHVMANAELFIAMLAENRLKGRFDLHGFVIMPDHVHLLLTPAEDLSLEKVVQFLKGGFSFRLKSKTDVWERGYDSRRITDKRHFETCRKYVEENPVRAGIVDTVEEYPYSSCGREGLVDSKPPWFA